MLYIKLFFIKLSCRFLIISLVFVKYDKCYGAISDVIYLHIFDLFSFNFELTRTNGIQYERAHGVFKRVSEF